MVVFECRKSTKYERFATVRLAFFKADDRKFIGPK